MNCKAVAWHICSTSDVKTLSVSYFISRIASMLKEHLPSDELKARMIGSAKVAESLEEVKRLDNPISSLVTGILQPLKACKPPSQSCCVVVDSMDESLLYTGRTHKHC